MLSLSEDVQSEAIEASNYSSRYLVDLLNIDNYFSITGSIKLHLNTATSQI